MIKNIKASGLLSFGPKGIDLPLLPLNVLIGANGSGKSNLLEVINLFREAPSPGRSLSGPIMDAGGIDEWLWKGDWKMDGNAYPARLECVVDGGQGSDMRHTITFFGQRHSLKLDDETIEPAKPNERGEKWWYYRWLNSKKALHAAFHDWEFDGEDDDSGIRYVPHADLDYSASILAQVRDPGRYKVFEHLQKQYASMELYRNWSFGPHSPIRNPARSDERQDRLGRSVQNLAVVIAAMDGRTRKKLVSALQTLYPGIEGVSARPVAGGALQLYLEEEGGIEVSAARLSDGTLRYLALLVILLDPNPPPLIAIEEPELGMHPDVIPKLAELLIDASERTQLVVTTHSRMLVDCLQLVPESIVVCEKHDGESSFERLDRIRMEAWLEIFSLGELWSKGELGGNRW